MCPGRGPAVRPCITRRFREMRGVMGRIHFLLPTLLLVLSCSCTPPSAEHGETFRITIGGHEAVVLVADNDDSRGRGLMFVKELGKADGMLFVYDEPQIANFWMKNTPIPLTLAYVDEEGVIFQVEYLEPYDTMTSHFSKGEIRWAIELERGWLLERGLGVGSKVDIGELTK